MEKLNYSYTQNRELSWLRFNERVLLEAEDEKVPLFEKFRFIWIFSSNLDEFCMIRIGSLTDLSLLKNSKIDNKTGQSPREQLDAIFDALPPLYKKRDNLYLNLVKELKKYDINQLSCSSLNKKQLDVVQKYFTNDILPILSSQIVDTHHPFPFLLNQELHIILELKVDSKKVIGIIPVPKSLPNILEISSEQDISYVFITDIIETHLDKIFTEYKILSKAIIRVTRNADLSADDEIADNEEDYREHMKKILKKRNRLQSVRLESNVQLNDFLIKYLCKNLIIKPEQCFISKTPLNMKYINELEKLIDPKILKKITYLKYIPKELKFNSSIIDYIKHNDLILNFPYQSMNPFINLIDEAAANPDVLSIKITIYRLANNSRLVSKLIKAAENGKEVIVLMELRARFDEQNNLNYTDILYEAGCKIIYGFSNYKVHSKLCLITIKNKNNIEYITQVGTGNYNEVTAKIYSDFSLITANQEIGQDANLFFKNMAMNNYNPTYKHLFAAPTSLKSSFLSLIDKEIAKKEQGYILFKMNSLTDRDFIDKLAEASRSGVSVKLIIRGICCILPGIENATENIEVKSIVGRFLEHARIYCFGRDDDMKMYLSSADLMTRNTERRIEIAAPVYDEKIKKEIIDYLNMQGQDNIKARIMDINGQYHKITLNDNDPLSSQKYYLYKYYDKVVDQKPDTQLDVLKRFFKNLFSNN